MSNFAGALKEEVRRLARKEIKAQTGATTQAVARFRREIAALKRQVRENERKVAFLEVQERKRVGTTPTAAESPSEGVRFSAKSVRSQRKKTGLSAANYAKLVGVSSLTIYNWELGKTRPRKEQLAALVGLRGIGKREALTKLELMEAAKGASKSGKARRKT